ncbi:MAG: HD domain-containing phosphohydrolase [Thermodesulfobacteriota bacterium]
MAENENTKVTILIVEDDPIISKSEAVFLEDRGYSVVMAGNGREGLEMFSRENPDLVLLDLRMPEMDGLEVLAAIMKDSPDVPVIIVSGVGTMDDAIKALKLGAWDFLTKPIRNLVVLEHAIERVLERLKLLHENKRHQLHLEEEVEKRTLKLQFSEQQLKTALEGIVDVVATMVEKRDPYTAGHQQRVADLAVAIARKLDLSERRIEGLRMAALIHDLGKVAIPSEILTKPSRLTDIEYRLIKTHAQVGYDILNRNKVDFPWPIKTIIHQHHEKLDGSGYPKGISGDAILFEARILTVADVVEAMATHRPYRKSIGMVAALENIHTHKETRFDPDVVNACQQLFEENKFTFQEPPR